MPRLWLPALRTRPQQVRISVLSYYLKKYYGFRSRHGIHKSHHIRFEFVQKLYKYKRVAFNGLIRGNTVSFNETV